MHKFKTGDKVFEELYERIKLTIIKTYTKDGEYWCHTISASGVKYEIKEKDLKFDYEHMTRTTRNIKHLTDKCRKCGGAWKKTNIGANSYYDCSECGAKAEDLCY
jgi:tRNA(Ile2) C34 agmatinyltransferase TiaS